MYIATYWERVQILKMENGKTCKTCQKCLLNTMQIPKPLSELASEFAIVSAPRTTWFEPSVLWDYTFLVIRIVIDF